MTRHKLERGTIAAFRREARHIIERDLHFSHRDNIIRVWADKGQTGLIAVANRTTGSVFKVKNFDLQFKYFFQVSVTQFLDSKYVPNLFFRGPKCPDFSISVPYLLVWKANFGSFLFI